MGIKRILWKLLIASRIWPRSYFTYSPFKILEFEAMMNGMDWSGTERVLDIGCGEGLQTLMIGLRCGEVTGIDVDASFVAEARWRAERMGSRCRARFVDAPLERADFADGAFDRIFSICVLEHIDNYEEVLGECLRVLAPGGEIIFSVDMLETIENPELVERHRQAHHVVRYFREDSLAELLGSIGFTALRCEKLFRSDLARDLFVQGIRDGFNFGRLRTRGLARALAAAEAAASDRNRGLFLLARAKKPGAGD